MRGDSMRNTLILWLVAFACIGGFLSGRAVADDCTYGPCQNPCQGQDGPFFASMKTSTCAATDQCNARDSQGNPTCVAGYCRTEHCNKCSGGSEGNVYACA